MITLEELKQVFDNLDEGIIFIDQNRHVIAINEAASRMLGQDHDATLNKLCPSLFQGTDCARDCEKSDHCTLMVETKQERKFQDLVVRRPDGALVQMRMWPSCCLPKGQQNTAPWYCVERIGEILANKANVNYRGRLR